MGDFIKSKRFKFLIGLLILLLFFMLRAAWTSGVSSPVAQAAGVVLTPLQKASASIADSVRDIVWRYARANETARENEQLREQINALREQLVDYEQFRQENEMLKSFLDIKERSPDFELEPASVVARDPNSRYHAFTIDKGSRHGISPRDTVICPDGLVGVVDEVGLNYSKVLTILDPAVNVSAQDVRTRDIGVVTGSTELAEESACRLNYLPRESLATAGDLVVTTGGGGIFPKGLIIGSITQVKTQAAGISLYAVVETAADVRTVTDVMVITCFDGQEVPDEP